MNTEFWGIAALLSIAVPAWGQYGGPAAMTRGEAPAGLTRSSIKFRPFIELDGIYDTGLAGVGVLDNGQLGSVSSPGVGLAWGISGSRAWQKGNLALDYRGSVDHFYQHTRFDHTNQSLLLAAHRMLSPLTVFTVRASAGIFSREYALQGLTQLVPFDPVTTYIPQLDFFNNRTSYVTAQTDLKFQKTERFSFDLGGDGSVVNRQSSALTGSVHQGARADAQYRLTQTSSIGAAYFFQHYSYTLVKGGTDIHSAVVTYARRFTRTVEFTGYGGFLRVESKNIHDVPTDPIIVKLLGIQSTPVIFHNILWQPNYRVRLSWTSSHGLAYVSAGHTFTAGNGLFLNSALTSAQAGYSYTGFAHWGLRAVAQYDGARSYANVPALYGQVSGNISASRYLMRSVNFVLHYYAREYTSARFANYRQFVNEVRAGFVYSPGDVPLRIW